MTDSDKHKFCGSCGSPMETYEPGGFDRETGKPITRLRCSTGKNCGECDGRWHEYSGFWYKCKLCGRCGDYD